MDHDDYSAVKTGSPSKVNQYGNHIKVYATVKMLNNLTACEDKKIDGCDFTEMVVLARVMEVDMNANRAKICIKDDSGVAWVTKHMHKQYLDTSDWNGHYYRFYLFPTKSVAEWLVNCQIVQPLESMNEIAAHMGNVMEGYLRRTKGPKK